MRLCNFGTDNSERITLSDLHIMFSSRAQVSELALSSAFGSSTDRKTVTEE